MSKDYKFSTLQEMIEQVPPDKLADCIADIAPLLAAAAILDVIFDGVQIETMTWADDGKHDIRISMLAVPENEL